MRNKKGAADAAPFFMLKALRFFHVVFTNLNGFHVQWDQLVSTLWQAVAKTFFNVLVEDDRTKLQECAEDNHVEHFAVTHV